MYPAFTLISSAWLSDSDYLFALYLNANANHKSHFTYTQSLVDACHNNGITCGVYSSASQWSAIFGDRNYAYGSEFPLW